VTESTGRTRARQAVRAYYAAVRALDAAALAETFASDALAFDPHTGFPIEGSTKLLAFFQALWAGFEVLEETPDAAFFAHDGAAVKWIARGVSRTGKPLTFEGINVFEVNDAGRIQTLWIYSDEPTPTPRTGSGL
jgi:steroid delta-isomerase